MFQFHAHIVCRVPAPQQNITETLSLRFEVLRNTPITDKSHVTHIIVAVYVKATV